VSKRIVTVAAVVLATGMAGYAVFPAAKPSDGPHGPVWTASTWPFPVDQFGGGWAFQCKAADCGTNVNLYLHPKIGFCNCQTGVADDEELDRVGDVDLVGSGGSALGAGRAIAVRSMKGRSRGYKVGAALAKAVLSIAFNSRCDVTVATVVADGDPVVQEQAVLDFLNSDLVMRRIEEVLGL
jgi:hypothetical protein